MFKIKRMENASSPQRLHQRLVVKGFKTSDAMYKFLNSQFDNRWQEYDGELKPGKYAFAGGQWHNVKTLDPSILAHI